jgi:hypothetical protein
MTKLDQKFVSLILLLSCTAVGCSGSSGGSSGSAGPAPRLARVESTQGAPGQAVEVRFALGPDAKDIVTVISELRFDAEYFSLETCTVGEDVGPGSGADKGYSYGQPRQGVVRSVVAGNMNAILPDLSVYSCRLKVAADTPPGTYSIEVSGEAADKSYADVPYSASAQLVVGSS